MPFGQSPAARPNCEGWGACWYTRSCGVLSYAPLGFCSLTMSPGCCVACCLDAQDPSVSPWCAHCLRGCSTRCATLLLISGQRGRRQRLPLCYSRSRCRRLTWPHHSGARLKADVAPAPPRPNRPVAKRRRRATGRHWGSEFLLSGKGRNSSLRPCRGTPYTYLMPVDVFFFHLHGQ